MVGIAAAVSFTPRSGAAKLESASFSPAAVSEVCLTGREAVSFDPNGLVLAFVSGVRPYEVSIRRLDAGGSETPREALVEVSDCDDCPVDASGGGAGM